MPTDLTIPVNEEDHIIGSASARVTLVEYGDYECPDCLNSEPIVQQLRERFGDDLRVVFRHFPQYSVHPHASAAAQAAEAAGLQGKFWEMHRLLFQNQQILHELDFTHLALQLGLDPYKFERDSEAGAFSRRVRTDHEGGERSGVSGTPAFFINGCKHRRGCDAQSLIAAIEAAFNQTR